MSAARTSPMAPRPRPALRQIAPGEHGGSSGGDHASDIVRADFSTSVNAYGPAPSVVTAIREALAAGALGAYPDPTCAAPRRALAAACGQPEDAIAVGAGAVDLLQAVALAFVRAGDRVLVPAHAFGEYRRAAILAGARSIEMPASRSDALEDAASSLVHQTTTLRPRIVLLAAPESPTGRAWPRHALREVADACARSEALLVLDQSFDAFASAPLGTPAMAGHPAVLHLRSLTKDHALPGLRLGYVIGPPTVVAAVERARMPWTVSTLAQTAAVAVCAPEAQAHMQNSVTRLRDAATLLRAGVARLGVDVMPSDVHYFVARVGDASAVARTLRIVHGLRVRACASFGLPEHVRIAARRAEENDVLLAALAEVLGRDPLQPRPRA